MFKKNKILERLFFSFLIFFPILTVLSIKFLKSKTATATEIRLPFSIPVLVLKYFPPDPNNPTIINQAITGPGLPSGTTIESLREKTEILNQRLINSLETGSSYHGYKNYASLPVLDYFILETREFLRPILRTANPDWEKNFLPDHLNELANLNICDYVENKGVKEVWIWMYHYTPYLDPNRYFVAPVESNMAGPFGDISNSDRFNDLPLCRNTYTVYEYNYGRDLEEALEDHTHQLEEIFKHVDYSTFWNKFVGESEEPFSCGWTHCPPNVMWDCDNHWYDWENERDVLSDCEDWRRNRRGERKIINCHTWDGKVCGGNGGINFKIWWMQNIPSWWWVYIGNFDLAVSQHLKLCDGRGDSNLDDYVNNVDITSVFTNWNPTGPAPLSLMQPCSPDFNMDNRIDEKDVTIVLSTWTM